MRFDLPAMARRAGVRRNVTLRPINPTQMQANDLALIIAPAWQVWRDAKPRIMASYTPTPLSDAGPVLEAIQADGVPERFNGEGRQDGTLCTGLTCRGFESHRHPLLTRDTARETVTAIEQAAGAFLTRLVTEIGPRLKNWVVRSERIHREKWLSAIRAGTGLDLSTMLFGGEVDETLEVFMERNVALVKDVSAQAQARISDAVFRGYQERTPVRKVAREIDEAVGLGRKRAVRVAADQASKLSAALDTERMAEAGIELWKYRHSGKLHPRSWHRARDGRIYTLKGNKQVNPDGSPMAGGDKIESGDEPGQPPWCGCRKQSYLSIMAELE